tara:strand:+ start:3358 stop:3942 length:585 start_codon:yes stop_codon:yes gene_type:complete
MNEFLFYCNLGVKHVLDLQAYDHLLFLVVLVLGHSSKQWKQILWLVTAFTLGHTLTLALVVFKLLTVASEWVELLIPATIFITAVYKLVTAGKFNASNPFTILLSFCFGWIHGLGFSMYLKMLLADSTEKLIPMLAFAFGIEAAQVLIVLGMAVLSFLATLLFKVSKRDWVLVLSAMVIGIALPMLLARSSFLF